MPCEDEACATMMRGVTAFLLLILCCVHTQRAGHGRTKKDTHAHKQSAGAQACRHSGSVYTRAHAKAIGVCTNVRARHKDVTSARITNTMRARACGLRARSRYRCEARRLGGPHTAVLLAGGARVGGHVAIFQNVRFSLRGLLVSYSCSSAPSCR